MREPGAMFTAVCKPARAWTEALPGSSEAPQQALPGLKRLPKKQAAAQATCFVRPPPRGCRSTPPLSAPAKSSVQG
jgi:hypothetical protein